MHPNIPESLLGLEIFFHRFYHTFPSFFNDASIAEVIQYLMKRGRDIWPHFCRPLEW
jgi:hypothetical protein